MCWGCQSGYVYVKLQPGIDVRQLEAQMPAWEKRNIPDEMNGNIRYNAGQDEDWHFVNFRDIHLGKAQDAQSLLATTAGQSQPSASSPC